MNQSSDEITKWVAFFVVALILGGFAVVLLGKTILWLDGEQRSALAGLGVMGFMVVVWFIRADYASAQIKFEAQINRKIDLALEKLTPIYREADHFRYEVKHMRETVEKYWNQCDRTISQCRETNKLVEEMMNQKSPVVVEVPTQEETSLQEDALETEPNVQAAVAEVVGGEI